MFRFKDALGSAERYNRRGISASISYLPRVMNRREGVRRTVREYERLLDSIAVGGLDSDVTVKLQSFGILRDSALAGEALSATVRHAGKRGNFVWVDMERASSIDATLDVFEGLYRENKNMGICLQAYHRRTPGDVIRIGRLRAPVRLVKGFYNDGDSADWREVTERYRSLIPVVLRGSVRPGIATHDRDMVREAVRIISEQGLSTAEVQFFAGVRDDLAAELVEQGIRVRVYIPYGNPVRYLIDGVPTFDIRRQIQRLFGRRTIR